VPKEDIKVAKPDEALQVKKEKWFYVSSLEGHVKVRKLTFGDLGAIYAKARDDAFEIAKFMIVAAIVQPRWSPQQVDQMKPEVATELSTIIADYSGMSRETLERTRNLSEKMRAMPSGT